jgi:hypothetical protein
MKKILFVVSHLGSDSGSLCEILHANPLVQFYNTKVIYSHIDVGLALASQPHKCDTTAAIWADELLHNHRLCHKCFYQWAQFVYVIKDARHSLHAMQPTDSKTADINYRYYVYRLRRICEMARKTPGAVLLTNLTNLKPLEGYLNLQEPLGEVSVNAVNPCKFVTPEHIRKGQESFERHYYYLRNLDLLR